MLASAVFSAVLPPSSKVFDVKQMCNGLPANASECPASIRGAWNGLSSADEENHGNSNSSEPRPKRFTLSLNGTVNGSVNGTSFVYTSVESGSSKSFSGSVLCFPNGNDGFRAVFSIRSPADYSGATVRLFLRQNPSFLPSGNAFAVSTDESAAQL